MKRFMLLAIVLITCFALGLTSQPVSANPVVLVQLKHNAVLVDGNTVRVTVAVKCAPVGEVLEAFLYVTQDGNQSQWGGIPVVCNNQPHKHVVNVSAFAETPFYRGNATATAYVLLYDPETGTTWNGGDQRAIQIR
jgi:hypothetical protein